MVLSALFALALTNAVNNFLILSLCSVRAQDSYLYLRWFWWRINAWSEIVGHVFLWELYRFLFWQFEEQLFLAGWRTISSLEQVHISSIADDNYLVGRYVFDKARIK